MSKLAKLEVLNAEQRNDVNEYFKAHSSRETAKYLEEQYGITVSYVSVIKFIEKAYNKAPQELKLLQYATIVSATDILEKFQTLYNSTKSLKARTIILSKQAEFTTNLLKTLDYKIPAAKLKSEEKEVLNWQEKTEDGQRLHTASKTATVS